MADVLIKPVQVPAFKRVGPQAGQRFGMGGVWGEVIGFLRVVIEVL